MLSWLSHHGAQRAVAYSYLNQRIRDEGPTRLDALLADAEGPETKADVLLTSHDPHLAWPRLDEFGDEVARPYWQRFSPNGLGQDFHGVAHAMERLLSAGRPATALSLLTLYSDRADAPRHGGDHRIGL